ncbi:MAG: hypothetical protein COU11_03000 [Candidatus Harrisonbacteria bacterium CG10_big_fil_rev_8_21_14_0_10_49_15]|uniref:Serine aminopeptidase S33 domain-containing protein n=1 Tax=Candidatus Harrisonbacteria bacterium CG10_big_fil_rev_8_21_14_0_10_49_15 TaxID=1974587 RepID=A0A2H0UKM5_9BACT|nr:MAG: hypothetical protein COU11_03000 [Candidatus Harrisonbacteria bacterium CG10_big_fil_rev_8_21_14_0_10_49_15]
MEKIAIKNRNGKKVAVLLEQAEDQQGLAFVMHGLSGVKEQPHIQAFAEAFLENGFTVVRFDTTNTFGESDGQYEDATTTNYYEDLEGVINWAKSQSWYQEPFWLAGHSMGGICTALYAENHPKKVAGLAPISTVVSGELSRQARGPENWQKWQETGWLEEPRTGLPGQMKRLKWSHAEDRLKYDLLPQAKNLTMPILFIVGEEDESTPPQHQQILFDAIAHDRKELHIIKDAPHTFRTPEHLQEIKQIMINWIKKYQ